MRVLFVASEAFPLVKTGGLGDVVGALPPALIELGVDVRILMPAYPLALQKVVITRRVAELGDPYGVGHVGLLEARMPDSKTPIYLIDCPELYDRAAGPYGDAEGVDWPDNDLRFGLLGWVAARLCQWSSPLEWKPDVLHGHDWQAGLAPAYLKAWGEERPKSLFTIHNIAYQGQYPAATTTRLGLPMSFYSIHGLEYYGLMSFLKAGCYYSTRLNTVSPTYAKEIQLEEHGCGLQGLMTSRSHELSGILNGVDYKVWNPAKDRLLNHRYSPGDNIGKQRNKAVLQKAFGLEIREQAPLFAMVSRLTWHKGIDLVISALPMILQRGGQVVIVGTGEHSFEDTLRDLAKRYPDQVAVHIGYSEERAHRAMAAADFLLMPSRSEPCGLTHLYAYRYGVIPITTRVGGLADTVVDCTPSALATRTGSGFVASHSDLESLREAILRGLDLYSQPDIWSELPRHVADLDFSWRWAAMAYRDLYVELAS
jgi:starch synthase